VHFHFNAWAKYRNWIIGSGLREQHGLAVLLLTSGGTARQWEELGG
jgi:hypothetical protein